VPAAELRAARGSSGRRAAVTMLGGLERLDT